MNDGNELDRDTRRGLRILAASTKQTSDRAAKRLERAADSGSRTDYLEAEAMFNSLPPENRRTIGSGAEDRAKIVKAKIVEQRMQGVRMDGPNAGAMAWELGNIPGNPKMPKAGKPAAAAARRTAKPATLPKIGGQVSWELNKIPSGSVPRKPEDDDDFEDGKSWDWQKIPDDPVTRSSSRKKTAEVVDEYELLRRQIFDKKS